jgi:hypothetical protein
MSHFTTVQTRIKDRVCLLLALKDLKYAFTEAEVGQKLQVRGYVGQKAEADIVVHISKTYDVGIRLSAEGAVLVADWWGVETTSGVTEQEFTARLTQRYAYHKVVQEVEKKGYQIVDQEETEDKHIHIRVRSWEE